MLNWTFFALSAVPVILNEAVFSPTYLTFVPVMVSYQNNIEAGTATVIVKGMRGYTGTVRKTFKIAAFDIKENANRRIFGLVFS